MFALQDQSSSRVPGRRMTKKKDGVLGMVFLHLSINTSRMTTALALYLSCKNIIKCLVEYTQQGFSLSDNRAIVNKNTKSLFVPFFH